MDCGVPGRLKILLLVEKAFSPDICRSQMDSNRRFAPHTEINVCNRLARSCPRNASCKHQPLGGVRSQSKIRETEVSMNLAWLYLEGAALSAVWYAFFTVGTWRQNPGRSVINLCGSVMLVG